MDKLLEFLAKARYPAVFLALGVILALAAAAQTIKILGIKFVAYGLAAHVGLGVLAVVLLGIGIVLALKGGGLARGIPSILFVAKSENLPFLLRQASQLPKDRFPAVRIHEYGTPENLKRIIRNNGKHLFGGPKPSSAEAGPAEAT